MTWTTILFVLTLLRPAAVPDVSGSWAVMGDVSGGGGGAFGTFSATCTFRQKDDKFDGVCQRASGDTDVSGHVSDQGVSFQYDIDRGGGTLTFLFNGMLDKAGTTITGGVTVDTGGGAGGSLEGTFTAKKQMK